MSNLPDRVAKAAKMMEQMTPEQRSSAVKILHSIAEPKASGGN